MPPLNSVGQGHVLSWMYPIFSPPAQRSSHFYHPRAESIQPPARYRGGPVSARGPDAGAPRGPAVRAVMRERLSVFKRAEIRSGAGEAIGDRRQLEAAINRCGIGFQ